MQNKISQKKIYIKYAYSVCQLHKFNICSRSQLSFSINSNSNNKHKTDKTSKRFFLNKCIGQHFLNAVHILTEESCAHLAAALEHENYFAFSPDRREGDRDPNCADQMTWTLNAFLLDFLHHYAFHLQLQIHDLINETIMNNKVSLIQDLKYVSSKYIRSQTFNYSIIFMKLLKLLQ